MNEEKIEEIIELLRIIAITNMRNHDALLVLLNRETSDGQVLNQKHTEGKWVADYPWLEG